MQKPTLLLNGLEDEPERWLVWVFPMNFGPLNKGVKYLIFNLNPNDYKFANGLWFFTKIETKISYGCHKAFPHFVLWGLWLAKKNCFFFFK